MMLSEKAIHQAVKRILQVAQPKIEVGNVNRTELKQMVASARAWAEDMLKVARNAETHS